MLEPMTLFTIPIYHCKKKTKKTYYKIQLSIEPTLNKNSKLKTRHKK